MSSPRRRQWRAAKLGGGRAYARGRGRGLVYILTGGRLGASGVTPVTHAHVERPRHGRRRASLWRPMARHGRCAGPVDWRHLARLTCHGRQGRVPAVAAQRPVVAPAPRCAHPTRVRHVRRCADVAARDIAAKRAPTFQGDVNSLNQFSNAISSKFRN
jgi:hypothetical protein